MKNLMILLIATMILINCGGSNKFLDLRETQNLIENRFQDSLFAHAHWGVLIESLNSGEIWFEQNADRMFMPASNEKISTTAAALLTLGPDFTFETKLYYTGIIEDSVLKGDLIVVGNGDPTFYTRFFDDPRDPFFSWADSLKKMGIQKIDGNIIGDDNAFDDQKYGMGWTFGGLSHWWSAEFGALQFNENYIDLQIIQPATKMDTIEIIPNISSQYFSIINNLTAADTGRSSIYFDRHYGTNQIIVSGRVLVGNDTLERSPSIWNPTSFYVTVLKETFENKGIKVTGQAMDCDEIPLWDFQPLGNDLILTHYSPPLKDILKFLMKKSQNMYAETMVRIMGLMDSGYGSFATGKNVVERVLENFGIEPDTYSYADGSGLSRYNFISPRQIVKILKGMRNSEYWEIWQDIQPIAGVDGTLKNRMRGAKAEGNVRAKTGTISNVRGLSGYVTTDDEEEIIFSFLVNGHLRTSRDTELITDSVLEFIAEYPFLSKNYQK
jgi:D-alanyl-D-alanine carboxypeptidase/D-alanyl-D-alanine-endopeptidase (penicillin-binding protein 4)